MKKMMNYGMLILLTLVLLVSFSTASAATPEEFYKGKTAHWVVGYSPGGLYDIIARLVAPFLEKHTGAQWIILNKPGGSSVAAINYLVNTAKPDGLTISFCQPSPTIVAQVIKAPEAKYDLTKVNFLGSIGTADVVLALRTSLPYKTLKEMMDSGMTFKFASVGRNSRTYWLPYILFEPAGLKVKSIAGYRGSPQQYQAQISGEVDCTTNTYAGGLPYIKAGDIRPIVIFAKKRIPEAPDVPVIFEVGFTGEAEFWADAVVKMLVGMRTLVTAPGVPKERVDFLRAALKKTMQEKGLLSTLDKLEAAPTYIPAEEIEEMYNRWLNLSPERANALKKIVLGQ